MRNQIGHKASKVLTFKTNWDLTNVCRWEDSSLDRVIISQPGSRMRDGASTFGTENPGDCDDSR